MPKLHSAVVGLAFVALAGIAPAVAGGDENGPMAYGYAPGAELIEEPEDDAVVDSYSEVTVRYGGVPVYGYGAAYVSGPPDLWRQREVAYDAIFTKEKRIIYDSGLAAQSRAAAEFYAPRVGAYAPEVYYRAPAYGPNNGPATVEVAGPIIDPAGSCGTFRYWDGAGCVDARYDSRYKNPYKRRYLGRY